MLAILSPAKTLDFDTPPRTDTHTMPEFLEHSETLIKALRKLSEDDIAELMSISPKLAELNRQRFKDWQRPFTQDNAKQALLAFMGDVYLGFELETFKEKDFAWAQDHVRILSGLYGLLKPLDLMQPYRLEMGTKFPTKRGKDLYAFWGSIITGALKTAIEKSGGGPLVNLASKEYFSAVKPKELGVTIITPEFKDLKNGQYKMISFFAKKARGGMTDFMIRERAKTPEALKAFNWKGYQFNPKLTKGNNWVFTRDSPEGA